MKLPRLIGPRPKGKASDGVAAEPSESRLREHLLNGALVVVPIALLLVLMEARFDGLNNTDALDYAQLGRNLAAGRGFVTYILRPLALSHGDNPLYQPDLTHGPLFPFMLALVFGAAGARDSVVAWMSGLFYLLTVPVLYRLGLRAFNRTVGLVAAAAFAVNPTVLGAASSGLPITLYVLLCTCLMSVLLDVAAGRGLAAKPPLVLAGVLTGALYLTEPAFFWLIPIVVGSVVWWNPARWLRSALWCVLPLAVVALPWMIRLGILTGNPIFGLRGHEIWMYTRSSPGFEGYRLMPDEVAHTANIMKELVKKLATTLGQLIPGFPNTSTSWALAFFVPGLFIAFGSVPLVRVRSVLLWCLLGLTVHSLLFTPNAQLYLAMLPVMLAVAAAVLVNLVQTLPARAGSRWGVGLALTFLVTYPTLIQLALGTTQGFNEIASATALGQRVSKSEAVFSDQPWMVAWYADRPSVWLPSNDARFRDLRDRFDGARWLYLTRQGGTLSPKWQVVYLKLREWNQFVVYTRLDNKKTGKNQADPAPLAVAEGPDPLQQGLKGLIPVYPVGERVPSEMLARLGTDKPGQPRSGSAPAPARSVRRP